MCVRQAIYVRVAGHRCVCDRASMCVRQGIYVGVAGHGCVCDRASMCVRHMYMCQILYARERKIPYECEGN